MADKNLSALTAGSTPLDGTEKMLMVEGADSRRTTSGDVAAIGSPIKTETGTTYTFLAADRNKWVRLNNAGSITATVNAATHTAGDEITVEQTGAGVFTLTAGAGMTLSSSGSLLASSGQYAVLSIKFITASLAIVVGDRA